MCGWITSSFINKSLSYVISIRARPVNSVGRSSPLTTSNWCGTSATPTDKESVVEDTENKDEEEEDEEERRARGGERGAEEEEVGQDKVDMTNLTQSGRSRHSRRTRKHSDIRAISRDVAQYLGTVGTIIYWHQGPRKTKRRNDLNPLISQVQRVTTLHARKTPY